MRIGNRRLKYVLSVFLFLLLCPAAALQAQAQKPASGQKKQQADHTIRVNVSLVQTDRMVFDKEGKFVPDLKLDQFELRIDGKVQPISFLDQVSAPAVLMMKKYGRKRQMRWASRVRGPRRRLRADPILDARCCFSWTTGTCPQTAPCGLEPRCRT